MPVFYKAVLKGSYAGQAINNILFVGDDAADPFPVWSAGQAADVAEALADQLPGLYTDPLPLTYTLDSVQVFGVNERGFVVGDYDVERSVNFPGDQDDTSDGAYNTAIISFDTERGTGAGRNMKRSYIAYGPLVSTWIGNDQKLTVPAASSLAPLLAFLVAGFSSTGFDYRFVRVGRTVSPAAIAYGTVVAATLSLNSSVRASRKKKPNAS